MACGLKIRNRLGTVMFSEETVGQSFIGTQYCAANSAIDVSLYSPAALTRFVYYIFPAQAFSPTFIMVYPTVSVYKSNSTTVRLTASGGNMAVFINVFGR